MRAGTEQRKMCASELVSTHSRPLDDGTAATADQFLERVAGGEPSAIGELYDLHHGAVRAFAKRLVGDASLAEDLVHEVFVSLPRAVRGYRGESSLRTFLISIAVNHARHHVRAATRRRSALTRYEQAPKPSVIDPERATQQRQLADLLTTALDTLPLEQRVAFVLCEVEERSSLEVAEIVGASEGTVRTRLFHAKKKLRAALEKEDVR